MASSTSFELGLDLEGTHILVTGGAGLIGSSVVKASLAAGAKVSSLDISYPPDSNASTKPGPGPNGSSLVELHADISSTDSLATAWSHATSAFGTVSVCVALASLDFSVLPQTPSLIDADPAVWSRVLSINVAGTMLTSQLWLRGIRDHGRSSGGAMALRNPSLIIIGSEAGRIGVRTCAGYAAGKAAVQYGLLQSLRQDAPRIHERARVNAVAPGPVDTPRLHEETGGPGTRDWWVECEATTALRRPVPMDAVARSVLFLASERWSGHVHGKIISVDSGKEGSLVWQPQESGLSEGRGTLQDGGTERSRFLDLLVLWWI